MRVPALMAAAFFFDERVDVVLLVARAVGAEVVVGVNVGLRRVVEVEEVHDVAGLVVQRAEELGVFHREARGAAAAHRETLDRATGARRDGAVGGVEVREEFADDEGLGGEFSVVGIFVERVRAAVGQHEDHRGPAAGDDAVVEGTRGGEGVQLVAACAVEVVDDGVAARRVGRVAGRQVDAVADLAPERRAAKRAVRDALGELAGLRLVDPIDRAILRGVGGAGDAGGLGEGERGGAQGEGEKERRREGETHGIIKGRA
jgi:hypothetical protein